MHHVIEVPHRPEDRRMRQLATRVSLAAVVVATSVAIGAVTEAVVVAGAASAASCTFPSWGVSAYNNPPTALTVGQSVDYQFVAPKAPANQTYTWDLEGSLPSGLTLSPSGLLSGTANSTGTYSYVADLLGNGPTPPDLCGNDDEQSYQMTVSPSSTPSAQSTTTTTQALASSTTTPPPTTTSVPTSTVPPTVPTTTTPASTTTTTTTPSSSTTTTSLVPRGAPPTGGGGTAGGRDLPLLWAGAAALLLSAASIAAGVVRRRSLRRHAS